MARPASAPAAGVHLKALHPSTHCCMLALCHVKATLANGATSKTAEAAAGAHMQGLACQ